MRRDVDNTLERPAIRTSRRRVRSAERYEVPRERTRRLSRNEDDQTRRKRNDRRSGAGGRRAARDGSSRPASRGSNAKVVVPVVLVMLVLLATSVVVAVVLTRRQMTPLVEEARTETEQAKQQISTLTGELDRLASELDATKEQLAKASQEASAEGTQTGVDDPWVASGKFTTGDTVLDGEVKAFCDSKVDTSMDLLDAAFEVYLGVAWSDYVERDAAQHPAGADWRTKFARMYYENGCSGNCYEFATFLSYCMRYLGFDDATAEGIVLELQSGDSGDHCVVFLTNTDGSERMLDTARGSDGWMLTRDVYNYSLLDFENA